MSIGKIPQRDIGPWARELITEMETSRKERISQGATWRSYYLKGSDGAIPAAYNKIKPHIERTWAYLYSPADVVFHIGYERNIDDITRKMAAVASSVLTKDFSRRDADLAIDEAGPWSLVKGCMFLKAIQGKDGVDWFIVSPEMMGVYRDDKPDFSQQQAFFHSSYILPEDLWRITKGDPRQAEIMESATKQKEKQGEEQVADDMFKQIIIGGLEPVSVTPVNNPAGGIVRWMDGPSTQLSNKVQADLIRLDELWVIDRDRDDYTTIQIAGEDTVVFGDMQHENLCGIKGEHPFRKLCPNPMHNSFWGYSQIIPLFLMQDDISKRYEGIGRMERLQENPPWGFFGCQAMNDEKWAAQNMPGGMLAEENPNAKAQELAPKMPENVYVQFKEKLTYFDDIADSPPIMQGQGEPGVRAGVHADTLVRTASPRTRTKALRVERQVADVADLHFRLLQAHEAKPFPSAKPRPWYERLLGANGKEPDEFLLSQLPDGFRVDVDSHSASPAFSQDAEQRAFALQARGAISASDLLRLIPIQHQDMLIEHAEDREKAQAELYKQHPELLAKQSGRRR